MSWQLVAIVFGLSNMIWAFLFATGHLRRGDAASQCTTCPLKNAAPVSRVPLCTVEVTVQKAGL